MNNKASKKRVYFNRMDQNKKMSPEMIILSLKIFIYDTLLLFFPLNWDHLLSHQKLILITQRWLVTCYLMLIADSVEILTAK